MTLSRAANAGRHSLVDRKDDTYETPPCAVRALLKAESIPAGAIWECACGPGAIARTLRAAGHEVWATDLIDYDSPDQDQSGIDFLLEPPGAGPYFIGSIVTNPPFKLGEEFVRHALLLCPRVYMLLRLAFLESERRSAILESGWLRRVHVFKKKTPNDASRRLGWPARIVSDGVRLVRFRSLQSWSDGAASNMTTLRDYQIKAVADIEREMIGLARNVLFTMATGAGKTEILNRIAENTVARGERTLILTHKREILKSTSRRLARDHNDHGLIQAGLNVDLDYPIQVASIQTFWSRCMRRNKIPLPHADVVIIDECHHTRARTWALILDAYKGARRLGLSATPCRGDGKGLGNFFDSLIEGPTTAQLITDKWLVPVIYYAPVDPDLKGVKVQAGDYQINALSARMDRDDLVADVISTWFKFGEGRKTICFAVNVPHSRHIEQEFVKAGVKCEHLDAKTPKADRDAILERLASGETQIVVNVGIISEGFDCPIASCIVLARPTKQLGLYRQMAGRGLRPAPGKSNLILIDHSGAVFKHGLLEDRVEWTLNVDKRAENLIHAQRDRGTIGRLIECSQCGAMRTAGEKCPHCGFLPQRKPDPIVFRDGELARLNKQTRTADSMIDPETRMRWHRMLTHIQIRRGHKPGWVYYKFKEKFGMPPPTWSVEPLEPTPEVLSWVRSRNIAWAKARSA